MPKYLIAYRKTDDTGQKPEWAVFTTASELSMEAHAVKERVVKRMSVTAAVECRARTQSIGLPSRVAAVKAT